MNTKGLESYGPLIGRVLISLIFLGAGVGKILDFAGSRAYMQANGLTAATDLLLVAAIVVELAGALALILGWHTRITAIVLALYLIPVTLIFHNFWAYTGQQQQMEMVNFLKNLAIMGGLVYAASAGARAVSLDRRVGRERPMREVHA